jgi:hypothetical protein
MGVFKNMRDLQKQTRENTPRPRDQIAARQARMASLSQMMSAQTQAVNAATSAAEGMADGTALRRSVMITGMRQIGMMNFDLLVEFDLTVLPDDVAPYAATTQQRVSQMQIGQLRPGLTLPAAVSAYNPAAIWLDLSGLS